MDTPGTPSVNLPDIKTLESLIEKLIEANSTIPVVVEGKRDRDALRMLGAQGEIITIHSGSTLYEFSEKLIKRYPEVILLTDWDKKGELLYGKLASLLRGSYEGHEHIRKELIRLTNSLIKEVEELPALMEYLKTKYPPDTRD
ncbi:MAG: topoisomerase [Nitrospirae bacterium]|nr:MAG: topoisomerase [Nitrospirota bacterium]